MVDEQDKTPVNENDEAPINDPVAVVISKESKDLVGNAHKDGTIRQRVIDHFAQQEIDKRVGMLAQALQTRQDTSKELEKLKPDQVLFDENGNKTSESWSKDQANKRKEIIKKLNKLDKAINKAVLDADYSEVQKFSKND